MALLLPSASTAVATIPVRGYGSGSGYCAQHGNSNGNPSISFDNVYACATTRSKGALPFDSNGNESFQCVELSARFLWAIYGIWAGPGSGYFRGADLVKTMHAKHPSIPVGLPGPGSVPAPGDVASFGPGGASDASVGHTAVVVASDPATGRFETMSENDPDGHHGRQVMGVDLGGRHDGYVQWGRSWTKASWLVLKTPPTVAPPQKPPDSETPPPPDSETPPVPDPSPGPGPSPGPSPAPTPTPTPTPTCNRIVSGAYATPCNFTPGTYQVSGTGSNGLYQHTGPGTSYPKITVPYTLAEHTVVQIACQTITSSIVNGSGVWDLLTDGDWVADYYLNTPASGNYSPGLAQCVSA